MDENQAEKALGGGFSGWVFNKKTSERKKTKQEEKKKHQGPRRRKI